jgi:hypothetical protein
MSRSIFFIKKVVGAVFATSPLLSRSFIQKLSTLTIKYLAITGGRIISETYNSPTEYVIYKKAVIK